MGPKKLGSRGGGQNFGIQLTDLHEAYIPNLGQMEIFNKHFSRQKIFWTIFWRIGLTNNIKMKFDTEDPSLV